MDSIMQTQKECYGCFRTVNLERHHCLHGTANRRLAEREGLWVWLCRDCHERVHQNHDMDTRFKERAQRKWMEKNGKSKEDFMKIFGRNYL